MKKAIVRLAQLSASEEARMIYEARLKAERDTFAQIETAREEGLMVGRTEGRMAGRMEGLAEGRTEGLAEGRTEGLAEGEARGEVKGKAEIVRAMRARGADTNMIAAMTGLSVAEIEAMTVH